MKQGSAEQLAENERRCKWSATLATLARIPVGETMEFPRIAVSETNRQRSILHMSGRTSGLRSARVREFLDFCLKFGIAGIVSQESLVGLTSVDPVPLNLVIGRKIRHYADPQAGKTIFREHL